MGTSGGHAAARAHGGDAGAAAAAAEFVGEGEDHAGTGHRDGVAEAAAAAEDVHGVLVEAEGSGGGDADRGEGLVDLPQTASGTVRPARASASLMAMGGAKPVSAGGTCSA